MEGRRSQAQILQFTRTLNQATILSGVNAQEARGGLIQLAQGIASDRFSGDEFRSVSENLPFVLTLIQRHLGVARGELRQLARQGALTGDVIVESILGASQSVEQQFGQTVPTVSQSLTVLGNEFTRAVAAIDDSIGITETFSGILQAMSNNIGLVITGLTALSVGVIGSLVSPAFKIATLGFTAAAGSLAGVTAAVNGLTVALLRNPITLAVTLAVTGAVAAFTLLQSRFNDIEEESARLAKASIMTADDIGKSNEVIRLSAEENLNRTTELLLRQKLGY